MCRNSSELRPAAVRCHCGYRGEERPVGFTLDGRTFQVHRIMDQRRVSSIAGILTEEFRVTVMTGEEFHLVFDPEEKVWSARVLK